MAVVGGLRVVAPKRFRIRRARQALPLTLVPDGPGAADLALMRGQRTISAATVRLNGSARRTVRLRLPRPLAAGTATLHVRFTAAGASRAVTRSLRLRFVAHPPRARPPVRAAPPAPRT